MLSPSSHSSHLSDKLFVGLPWKSGGRSRAGVDCVGLAKLWLTEQLGFKPSAPPSCNTEQLSKLIAASLRPYSAKTIQRGDVLFLHHHSALGNRHVVICLGENRFLNIFAGCTSRIENGLTLIQRVGFVPHGFLRPNDTADLCRALSDPGLGDPATIILLAVAVVAMAVSYALQPSLSGFNRQRGRYSQSGLVTQRDPELPLPDLLGSVVVAGNSIYQQLPDSSVSSATPSGEAWDQVLILCSGPVNQVVYNPDLYIKGVSIFDPRWHSGNNLSGIYVNPIQDKDNSITGNISGDTKVSSVTIDEGDPDIAITPDIRASYDRDFPLYGLSGCASLIWRFFDSSKFDGLNFTCRVQGRALRTFDNTGFIRATQTDALTQAGSAPLSTRFKLSYEDIESVSSLTVNGTAYTLMSASNQTGAVYWVNKTKGYIEFPSTVPAASAAISVTYTYFPRVWSQNPASQIIYLLTEKVRGKGLDESRIDWASAYDLAQYCDEVISWVGADASTSGPRFISNYAVDDRKPIQDHITAILNACNGLLFFSGGKFVLRARKATDSSVFSFDASSILVDTNGESAFEADLVDRATKINRARVLFHSDQALQAEEEVDADDEDNQAQRAPRVGNDGVVDDNLKFPAVTTTDQAERLALMIVTEQVNSSWVYKWTTNLRGLALQPGDVVDLTHPCIPGGSKNLRIETLEYDENDRLAITAAEFVPAACI